MSLQLVASTVGERLKFGEFELAPAARTLWRSGHEVRLGSRALDILIALASRPGQVLSKDELTSLVWRGAATDETALRVGISAVRKALGDGADRIISTVPGRGYCFVLDVEVTTARPASEAPNLTQLKPRRLPAQIERIVGRDKVIESVIAKLAHHRLVSLVGPGGIGKTTVALAVADHIKTSCDAVAFIDLATVIPGDSEVAAATASALGLHIRTQENPIEALAAVAEDRSVLLVLDNCEHLVESVAAFAEALLGVAPGVTLLTTSRERLRAAGEWVHQLAPLDAPPASATLSAEEARRFPAVEMFEERAAYALGGYQISDEDAPHVAEICRRLDGIALAIELAAGQLAGLGVQRLASSVDDCFRILTHGRRTAIPRHQTLKATLDWSYQLLPVDDQAALRCLSVFQGGFTLEDATFVLGPAVDFGEANERLISLVDKSFVAAKPEDRRFRYRLLETTRLYGQEKLRQHGDDKSVRRRHAERVKETFDRVAADEKRGMTVDWLKIYGSELGNVRAALDWAFQADGDGDMGAAITATTAPVWLHLSLLDEGLSRVARAIAWLKEHPSPDKRLMMQLYAISGWPQMNASKAIPTGAAAWHETLGLAVDLDDIDFQLRALWALSVDRSNNGAATEALSLSDRFAAVAERAADPQDRMVGQRMRGKALHFLGDLAGSRREIERMLERYVPPPQRSHIVRFQYEQRLTAQVTLARSLWLQGFANQALSLVEHMITDGVALGHTLTLAHILSDAACFIALWAGDLALATRYTAMLREHTALHALDVWRAYAVAFEGELLIREGMAPHGILALQRSISALEAAGFVLHTPAFEAVLAEGLILCRRFDDADEIVSNSLARCQSSGAAWCTAELMRVRALGLASRGRTEEAIRHVVNGIEVARSQGALAWELRLARTRADLDDDGDAARKGL